MKLSKEFELHCAHHLENYEGKCHNAHGHTYRVIITLKGFPNNKTGMLIDFGVLKDVVNKLIVEKLDHTDLNITLGSNPTAENMAMFIYHKIQTNGYDTENFTKVKQLLYSVTVYETPTSFVEYREKSKLNKGGMF